MSTTHRHVLTNRSCAIKMGQKDIASHHTCPDLVKAPRIIYETATLSALHWREISQPARPLLLRRRHGALMGLLGGLPLQLGKLYL